MLAVVAAALAAVAVTAPANAYELDPDVRWPNGVVRLYNGAPGYGWSLYQAIRAWNDSGARVRFLYVRTREQADLLVGAAPPEVILHKTRSSDRRIRGVAFVGYDDRGRRAARVWLVKGEDRYTSALILAHELGHVLGLGHEDDGCALMNSGLRSVAAREGLARSSAPYLCRVRPGTWRCRIVTRDDVLGAIQLYGGRVRAPAVPELCPQEPGGAASG